MIISVYVQLTPRFEPKKSHAAPKKVAFPHTYEKRCNLTCKLEKICTVTRDVSRVICNSNVTQFNSFVMPLSFFDIRDHAVSNPPTSDVATAYLGQGNRSFLLARLLDLILLALGKPRCFSLHLPTCRASSLLAGGKFTGMLFTSFIRAGLLLATIPSHLGLLVTAASTTLSADPCVKIAGSQYVEPANRMFCPLSRGLLTFTISRIST
jgi:hypothetical protein